MTARQVLAYHQTRWRKPWVWAVTLSLVLVMGIARLLQLPAPRVGLAFWTYTWLTPLIVVGSLAWVSPWAWLWTGRADGHPSGWRGLPQGLLLGAACFVPTYALDYGWLTLIGAAPADYWAVVARPDMVQSIPIFCLVGFATALLDRAELRRAEAERQAHVARWHQLQSQLDPHVFFNAMNNLIGLIRFDPVRAEQAATDLADLLRRLLEHGRAPLATLAAERQLMEKYLAVESLRLGPRMTVSWNWASELDRVEAPPLLLQPLVENAVKHGIAPSPGGGSLHLSGTLADTRVVVRVANTGGPLVEGPHDGVGLSNLRARLDLAFGADASLRLFTEGRCTVAEIAFPRLEEWR